MELVDIVNEKGKFIRTQDRNSKLNEGEYIKSVHIYLLKHNNEIYIQQRSTEKVENPNLWEVVGGGVLSNEDIKSAALRELKEETGIIFDERDLTFMGTLICDKYLVNAFIARINKDYDFIPQLNEIKNSMFVDFEEILNLINSDRFYSSSFGLFQRYFKEQSINEKV